MWGMYQPLLRQDFRLFDEYQMMGAGGSSAAAPLLACPLTTFFGSRDRRVKEHMVQVGGGGWGTAYWLTGKNAATGQVAYIKQPGAAHPPDCTNGAGTRAAGARRAGQSSPAGPSAATAWRATTCGRWTGTASGRGCSTSPAGCSSLWQRPSCRKIRQGSASAGLGKWTEVLGAHS
jgi:hypothetical protein